MKEIKCEECPCEAEYFWKDGKDYIPVCGNCAGDWLKEEAVENNNLIDFNDLEEEDFKDYIED